MSSLLEDILAEIKPREETVKLAGKQLVVREIPSATDLVSPDAVPGAPEPYWQIIVRSVFNEAGEPVFTDADVPALKAGSKGKLRPLFAAVNRVNGLDVEENAKNSDAAQA